MSFEIYTIYTLYFKMAMIPLVFKTKIVDVIN